jgi:hypothetical protein
MKFKARLERTGLPRRIYVEIFTNSNIEMKASPEVGPSFNAVADEMERILQESRNILSKQSTLSVRVNRAARIKEYINGIPVENDVGKMVIVTLCDIILDLLVSEKLSKFTSRREDLENESIMPKIRMLEARIPVYKSKEIQDIRNLRNKVVHGGSAIAEVEAASARDTTIDIYELF